MKAARLLQHVEVARGVCFFEDGGRGLDDGRLRSHPIPQGFGVAQGQSARLGTELAVGLTAHREVVGRGQGTQAR